MATQRTGRTVLITFARSYLTLDLARAMAAAGHRVLVADSMRTPVSRFSNAVDTFVRVPSPRYRPAEYAQALARLCREEHVDLLVPIHEETDILAMFAHLFPAHTRLFLSDFNVENTLHNKFEYQRKLDELGIPTLAYAQVADPGQFAGLEFDAPFAFKQVYSRGSQQVYKVGPGEPMPAVHFEPGNPWLAQEWLTGDRYCTYSVCVDGEVLAHATYPVRYAIDGNSCLSFEQVEHPAILQWVRRFVAAVGYTGQVGFDFIEHPDRGLFTIECNPRATSGVMMFEPTQRLDRAFFGDAGPLVQPDRAHRTMIGPGMLIYGWRSSARPAGVSLARFARDYWAFSDVITSRADPLPALTAPLAYLGILAQCRRYHVGLAEGFMHDHEWDGVVPPGAGRPTDPTAEPDARVGSTL